jgi:hypothetical protein
MHYRLFVVQQSELKLLWNTRNFSRLTEVRLPKTVTRQSVKSATTKLKERKLTAVSELFCDL